MSVSWVAGSTLATAASGTSVSSTTPAGIANDDTLLACVFGRSALTTPAGWTKLIETASFTNGVDTQTAAVFSKNTVTTGDASTSFTWSQASSGRIGVAYAVLRGVDAVAASSSAVSSTVDSWSPTPPALTADGNGQLFLLVGSTVNQSSTQTPTAPAGSTIFTGGAATNYRLAGAYQLRDNGEANSGSFNMAPTGGFTSNGLGAITLRFSAADSGVTGYVSDTAGPLGEPQALSYTKRDAYTSDSGPLGQPVALARQDFSSFVSGLLTRYVMDLVTPAGIVRVPISSWQATLQTEGQSYLQCVVPACASWVDEINAATEFVISRSVVLADGRTLEAEMARGAPASASLAQGGYSYSATITGYSDSFAIDTTPAYARTLAELRTAFNYSGKRRIRCSIDWLLRPGQTAVADGDSFTARYISYYVNDGDTYMDVAE